MEFSREIHILIVSSIVISHTVLNSGVHMFGCKCSQILCMMIWLVQTLYRYYYITSFCIVSAIKWQFVEIKFCNIFELKQMFRYSLILLAFEKSRKQSDTSESISALQFQYFIILMFQCKNQSVCRVFGHFAIIKLFDVLNTNFYICFNSEHFKGTLCEMKCAWRQNLISILDSYLKAMQYYHM